MLLIFVGIFLICWLFPPLYTIKGIANYTALHTLLEFIAIIVSMLVFAVVWSAYDKDHLGNFMLLASIFFGVAILDFLHTISYPGMPIFITPSGPEKAIDFWLAARSLLAFGLLIITFLPWRPMRLEMMRWLILMGILSLVGILTWVEFMQPEWIPRTFIPGYGLTPFKINAEYFIIFLYMLAALRFLQQMHAPKPYDVMGLFTAVTMMALSELFFTLYADVTDIFNLLGHIYKVIAYTFIYRSVFFGCIRAPYQRLYESRNLLQAVIEAIPFRVFWKDREFRYMGCNTLFANDAGKTIPENVIGKFDTQLVWKNQANQYRNDDRQVIDSISSKLSYEEIQTTASGRQVWLRTSKAPLYNLDNDVIGILGIYEDITQQKRAENELRFMQTAVAKSKSAFYKLNSDGVVLYANDYACEKLGYDRIELVGQNFWDFMSDFSAESWFSIWAELKKTEVIHIEALHQRKNTGIFPVDVVFNFIALDEEQYCFVYAHDITERKQATEIQTKLARALKLLSKTNSLLVHAQNEQAILDDVCNLIVETGGYQMAWVGFKENNESKTVKPIVQSGKANGYLDSIQISWADTALGQGPTGTAIRKGKTVINQNTGSNPVMSPWKQSTNKYEFRSSIALPLFNDKYVFGVLSIYSDIPNSFVSEEVELLEELAKDLAYGIQTIRTRAAQEEAEKKVEFLAYHDPLTGLPNRLLLLDRFDQAVALSSREQSKLAVFFLDLDNFKHINDSLGHAVGDQLLVKTVERIKTCIRETDTISRQGGDEFIILLPDLHELSQLDLIAQAIIDIFDEPISINQQLLNISFSIGISLYPDDSRDVDVLLKHADTALYQSKDAGKNTYRFFSEQMNIDAVENMKLQSELHDALKNEELFIHYQPQIDCFTGHIIGAEALLRWQHPERGLVSPAKFIPLAERSGLICTIGEWVLNEACKQAQLWRETAQMTSFTISVNLSALQIKRGNIIETVTNALDLSGLPASYLELELTESTLFSNLNVGIETLHNLKKIGVKLSIDDFGTGYSSLSYLKQLSVDKLKIDQSFVRDMVEDSDDAAIVKAIIQLGHNLQLTVIAEGVENEGQLAILKRFNCDEIQGYLYSRPVTAAEFVKLFQSQKS